MKRLILIAILVLSSCSPTTAHSKPRDNSASWAFIIEKLILDGLDEKKILKAYSDPRMPALDAVYFKVKPREPSAMYAGYRDKKLIDKARTFMRENKAIFQAAWKKYQVAPEVIAAILLVETRFGANTGKHIILNRLSRLASIAEPENILENFNKLQKEDPEITYQEVANRAIYLEKLFYPEVLALFKIADSLNIDILDIKGSYAGAFGYPQFLPSTYLNFAVDGNGDGKISLFNMEDTIHSIANYLKASGWKDNASQKDKESVIWKYNRSEAYIDTVLYIADKLKKP